MPDLGQNTQLAVVSPGIFNSVPDKMGHFWYVDGTNGNDGNDGLTPSTALRTWSQAMAKIDARGGGHGDTVFGTPGSYVETIDQGGGVYSIKNGYIGPRNTFADKNKACYIDFTTTNGGAAADQTGTIEGNFFCCDAIVANTQVKIVGTGFTFPGNFDTVGVVDGSGLD